MRGRPQSWWSTFGRLDFIRVDSPAARISAVSFAIDMEIVARRVPSIDRGAPAERRAAPSHRRGLTRVRGCPPPRAAAEMRQQALNSVGKRRRKFEDLPRRRVLEL